MVMNLGKRFLSGWSCESLRSTLGKGTQNQSLETICWNRSGTRNLQERYLIYFIGLCRWNNFTDDWNIQIVSKAEKKLRKHIQKWKIKLLKALSLAIVLKMQCHLSMYSLHAWLSLVLWCFENLLSNGTAALLQLLRKMQRMGKRPWEFISYIYRHVQLIKK